jgi:magnesium-protoporphyrin O-methyltransferase
MAFFTVGKAVPAVGPLAHDDPHSPKRIAEKTALHGGTGSVSEVERVSRGFYISTCLEYAHEHAQAHIDPLPALRGCRQR